MKRLLLLLLPVCFLTPLAAAQEADSIAAHRFAPLHVGNAWHFEDRQPPHHETNPPPPAQVWRHVLMEVVADTVISGQRCVEVDIRSQSPRSAHPERSTEFARFDEEVGNLVRCSGDGSWLEFLYASPCPLDAEDGDFIDCGEDWYFVEVSAYTGALAIGDDEVEVTIKTFVPSGMEVSFTVASDIGFTYSAEWYSELRLIYARVDGTEYGAPLFVDSDPSPAGPSPLALTVYPNPAPAGATVAFALPAAQEVTIEVFDLLGRRVRQQGLGALPAGEHEARLALDGLPAGTFVVRLTGDAGAVAAARLVRQRGE